MYASQDPGYPAHAYKLKATPVNSKSRRKSTVKCFDTLAASNYATSEPISVHKPKTETESS